MVINVALPTNLTEPPECLDCEVFVSHSLLSLTPLYWLFTRLIPEMRLKEFRIHAVFQVISAHTKTSEKDVGMEWVGLWRSYRAG